MNIRNLGPTILPIENRRVGDSKDLPDAKATMLDTNSQERDADGRRDPNSQGDEPDKSPLTETETIAATKHLEETIGLTAKGFTVEVQLVGEIRVFLIRDQNQEVVRRIPDWEMRTLVGDKEKRTGHIFDKAV
jgi:hypothetical protein